MVNASMHSLCSYMDLATALTANLRLLSSDPCSYICRCVCSSILRKTGDSWGISCTILKQKAKSNVDYNAINLDGIQALIGATVLLLR